MLLVSSNLRNPNVAVVVLAGAVAPLNTRICTYKFTSSGGKFSSDVARVLCFCHVALVATKSQ
jgi:hypothetical protein